MALAGKDERYKIWTFFKGKGYSEEAIAGIMGNLYAESGLHPNNLENTKNSLWNITDEEYTKKVDAGTWKSPSGKDFVHDNAGYGLAQWTYYTLKESLLNSAKSKGTSISNVNTQLDLLHAELRNTKYNGETLESYIKNKTDIKIVSDYFLVHFENPKDQSDSVKKKRYEYGRELYDELHGKINQTAANELLLNYAIYPVGTMNITQNYSTGMSHPPYSTGDYKDYPIDEAGADSGRDYMVCPCNEIKIVRIYGVGDSGTNTIWLESTQKAYLADNSFDFFTMMVVHPNDDDLSKLKVGQTFTRNQKMFREGTDGHATGNHFHISVGKGKHSGTGWIENNKGKWVLTTTNGACKPEEIFYVDKNITTVKEKQGIKFKELVSDAEYEAYAAKVKTPGGEGSFSKGAFVDYTDWGSTIPLLENRDTQFKLWDKQYRLRLVHKDKKTREIGKPDGNNNTLRVNFSVQKKDASLLQTSNISIWNLSRETISFITDEECAIELRAGYGKSLPLIFAGTVAYVTTQLDGADRKTTIELFDGYETADETDITFSIKGKSSCYSIFERAAKRAGIITVYSKKAKSQMKATSISNFSYSGMANGAFNQITSKADCSWRLENGTIRVTYGENDTVSDYCILLSPDSGLIDEPVELYKSFETSGSSNVTKTFWGYQVKFLMNTALTVNDRVYLKSRKAEGVFRVDTISTVGDNMSSSWHTTAELAVIFTNPDGDVVS